MAGRHQSKEQQLERVVPSIEHGTSRVSKAAGSIGARRLHAERHIEIPVKRQHSRSRSQATSRRSRGGQQSHKKSSPRKRTNTLAPPTTTRDTQFIQWLSHLWNSMEPHHQQRFYGALLFVLSLFLFGTLTVFHSAPPFTAIFDFFMTFFGWSAYPLAGGLIIFSVAHLIESRHHQTIIRWPFVIGLLLLWLLTLIESRLLIGPMTGGVLAEWLVQPLLGWPPAIGHICTVGLFSIITIITFRITFDHILFVGRLIARSVSAQQGRLSSGRSSGPSPFLGQRPRFSRYGSGLTSSQSHHPTGQAPAAPRLSNTQLSPKHRNALNYQSDADNRDDPLNDIRIHQGQVGMIPHGSSSPAPQSLDIVEHREAVQGAHQPALPFQSSQNIMSLHTKDMEPLAPNPLRVQQPMGRSLLQATTPLPSPWNIPNTSFLNNPEAVKQQLFGDDTSTLAKTIQDTLRSFRVEAEVKPSDISIGPTVIRFGIRPTGKPEMRKDEKGKLVPVKDAMGSIVYETRTRVSRIMALQNDLALVLEAKTIRMEAPVPGRPYVGVEIPNKHSRLVTLREVLESKEFQTAKTKSKLTIALGKDVAGVVRVGDLTKMPHLLIAGATGAGKCLAYNEPLFLADGRIVKVQELIGQSAEVMGVTNLETMQQVPVSATFTENGIQDVFEIKLDNGLILRRTGEHPLWAACLDENQHVGREPNGKATRRTRAIGAGWVQARDIRICGNRPNFDGHVILCPTMVQQKGQVSRSDADVILCAVLMAEGSLNQYDYISYRKSPGFSSADSLIVEMVAEAAKAYNCKVVLSKNGNREGSIAYYIVRNSLKGRDGNPISKLVHDWGIDCLATQKTIPAWVFQLPNEQIALFLCLFIDCDGWFSVRGHSSLVSVSLANPLLIQQIGQLALRLGITGTYTHKENGFAGAWTWASPMVQAWQERVGSLVKKDKLACAVVEQAKGRECAATKWTAWRQAHSLVDQTFANCPQDYEWRKIVAIRRITAPTVNIEVHSENHAFVGYAVEHNSVCINTIIASMLTQATPEDVRMLMVDPKMVELSMYSGIPHLLSPVVTEVEKVVPLLKNAIAEMERRYRLFSQLGVRNLESYRKLRAEKIVQGDTSLKNLPAIVIIIDELADLMMAAPEEVEGMICRLAQLARATGIHLVVATQRPSVDVITGLIKANIPTRISFMVSSSVDSRTIIDMGGAERLLGRGDMLYLPADVGKPERIQGAFLADEEAEKLVEYWRQQLTQHTVASNNPPATPSLSPPPVEPGWEIREHASDDFELDDDLLAKAEEVVREYERASVSLLQRRLRIGYSRAARLIDLLEERGVIGASESGGRHREILESASEPDRRMGNGRTMADEVVDIIAEERTREEALKRSQKSSD